MRKLLTFIVVAVLVLVGLLAGALAMNRLPLTDEPGFGERLRTYARSNVAETRPDHVFPELRSREYTATESAVLDAVAQSMRALGHSNVQVDLRDDRVSSEVVTRLLRFTDDVSVTVEAQGERVRVDARSASRVGRGDLGANTRHLLDLFAAIDERLH